MGRGIWKRFWHADSEAIQDGDRPTPSFQLVAFRIEPSIASLPRYGYHLGFHEPRASSPTRSKMSMRLSEILKPQNIKVSLDAKNKAEAIAELVNLLAANAEITDPKQVLEAVLDREATRTTGIGNGLAIPHGKCNGTGHLSMAIGRPATPIDFQAIDGRPVTLIWLLTSPPDKTGPHIHALARISRLMTIDKFRQALATATTSQELYDVIVQQENAL
jgi:fructose-specific phosphotransferase system IIA component